MDRSEKNINHDKNNNRSILKGISAFGGVQLFQILIALIRGKFVAMFLGPEGMGISSLFNTSANTIQIFSSLGLNLAIVKEVAEKKENPSAFKSTLAVAGKLITLTALFGALFCILFSSWLSEITFGDSSYSWQFMLLSLMVFFTVAGNGKLSILQGLHDIKRISKASIVGGLTGLLAGVPLYYFWGDKGIVPAMVLVAFSIYLFYTISLNKSVKEKPEKFIWQSHKPIVKKLISLGLILMAGTLIGNFTTYLLNLFIRSYGNLEDVGFFQAANSITNQYSSLLFAALAMDYFPRLSEVASDNLRMKDLVNRQSELIVLLATPLSVIFITMVPLVIRILLTPEFLPVTDVTRWFGAGVLVRAMMFPMGYITFAKDNKTLFFWLEGVFTNVSILLFSCIGYYWFGIIGLGYALIIDGLLSLIVYTIINRKLYEYKQSDRLIKIYFYSLTTCTIAVITSYLKLQWLAYSLLGFISLASLVFSIFTIKKGIKERF